MEIVKMNMKKKNKQRTKKKKEKQKEKTMDYEKKKKMCDKQFFFSSFLLILVENGIWRKAFVVIVIHWIVMLCVCVGCLID